MADQVVVDERTREVFVGASSVRLTRIEFDLLAHMASRPGEVLGRDELLEKVWHSNREWQSPATVSEHIRRLRAKLDPNPAEPSLITTVRGVGYRFEPRSDNDSQDAGPPDRGASQCLAILDGTRILYASPALLKLLGAGTPDEIVGRDALEFVADDSLPAARHRAEVRADGEQPRPDRVTIRTRDGTAVADIATSVVNWDGRLCHQASIWPVHDASGVDESDRSNATLRHADEVLLSVRKDTSPASRNGSERRRSKSHDELASDIARGINAGEFEPYYEPVVHLETGRVVAVEALARWHHPTRGLLSPAAFLDAAERSGHIVSLGRHLLHASCAQVADWERNGHTVDLAVNLSARQLLDGSIVDDVTAALDVTGLPGDRLLVEITETDLIEDIDGAALTLRRLADHGARVSIDDFGTGWASLTYLNRFPVHILKIDRSFTAGVTTNGSETAIARAILSLGSELDLLVIAEGIETADQQAVMYDLGCWLGQGYYFARPQPGPEVTLSRADDPYQPTDEA